MRYLALIAVLALFGCQAIRQGPDPYPGRGVRVLVHVSGDFDGQVLAEAMPLTALIQAHGTATITGRAFPPPYLTIDGDYTVIVEPTPGREAEAIAAVERGDILIRRAGQPAALNAPGTIKAFKAAIRAASSAPVVVTPPKAPTISVRPTDSACVGGVCTVPHR